MLEVSQVWSIGSVNALCTWGMGAGGGVVMILQNVQSLGTSGGKCLAKTYHFDPQLSWSSYAYVHDYSTPLVAPISLY